MYKDGAAWADLTVEYKNSLNMIKEIRNLRKNSDSHTDAVDCEIAGSMESDLTQTARELKKKVLYEYNTITEEDILNPLYGLTERQKEIALLKQIHSYKEIAKILSIDQSTVFRIFRTSIDKILRVKQQQKQNEVLGLSKKQQEIYELYIEGITPTEIGRLLSISINSVKTHLRRIKQKIEGDKTIQIEHTG